jgi:hypothetical protein
MCVAAGPATAWLAATDEDAGAACGKSHVRAMDARAQAAIDLGLERSATFRELVNDLRQSDLIVYIGTQSAVAPINGEIHFVTTAGDHRYLRVFVRAELSPWDRAAMVAHELQHAREIAAAPEVIDNASMDALYHAIGYGVGVDRHETDAAREITLQVLRELAPGSKTGGSQ